MTPAVADTSFIIGVIVSTDAHHARCVQAYKLHNPIYVPQTTLAETAYLITREVDNKATALYETCVDLRSTRFCASATQAHTLF